MAIFVLLSLACTAPHASAGRPVFTTPLPPMGVIAGTSNGTVYDLSQSFTDPDGDPLTYYVTPVPGECAGGGPAVTIQGHFLALSSDNASSGIRCTAFMIGASDPGGAFTGTPPLRAWVGPPPSVERRWNNYSWSDNMGGGGIDPGCTGPTNLYPLAVEGDARFTEFSVIVGRGELLVSWPTWTIGGSPADDTSTAGQVVGFLGEQEVLNRSLPRDPTRVYLDTRAINAYVAAHPSPFNVVMVPLGIGICAWDGTLTYVIGKAESDYVRLPPGDSGSDLDPNPPAVLGAIPDLDVPAGGGVSPAANLSALFDDADGDPLEYQVNVVGDGWQNGTLLLEVENGSFAVRSLNASWLGNLTVNISAMDPAGAKAFTPNFSVRVGPWPINASGPLFTARLDNGSMYAGQRNAPVIDVVARVSGGRAADLLFEVTNETPSEGWQFVKLGWRAGVLYATTWPAENQTVTRWTGALCFEVRVRDYNNLSAGSNEVCVVVKDPSTAPPLPAISVVMAGAPAADAVAEGTPLSFAVNISGGVPPDLSFVWYNDGSVIGTGPNITGVLLPVGTHTVAVKASNGIREATVSVPITVGRTSSLPPAQAGQMPLAAIAAAGLTALAGAVILRRGGPRYRLLGILFAVFAPGARRPAPLDHFVRGALYQEIKREPGIHFEELRRRTELPNGQASHHLRVLERGGLVRAVSEGNRLRFYPTDARPNAEEYGLPLIDREVRDLVERKPGITQHEIRAELGRSASMVSRSVRRLSVLGLVTTARKDRGVAVFPRAPVEKAIHSGEARLEHPGT